ncbi:13910_t:CDS:2 [Funneliformis geosporum]|nr:13910_t:CDS:2 [Funneliformis geosporum]
MVKRTARRALLTRKSSYQTLILDILTRGYYFRRKVLYVWRPQGVRGKYTYRRMWRDILRSNLLCEISRWNANKKKKWEKLELKERFVLQDGMLLQFRCQEVFETCRWISHRKFIKCGCDKITVVRLKCGVIYFGDFGNVHLVRKIDGQLFAAKISKSSLLMEYIAINELDLACVVESDIVIRQLNISFYIRARHNSLTTWIKKQVPDNVENERPLSLLITDFGLSRRLSSNPSEASGTPLFCK